MREVTQQVRAMRRVDDLGMELDAVVFPGVVGDDGEGRAIAGADRAEPIRQPRHAVAVAHPDLLLAARRPATVEQLAVFGHRDEGAPEFAVVVAFHFSAEFGSPRPLALSDHWHPQARAPLTTRSRGRPTPRGPVAA